MLKNNLTVNFLASIFAFFINMGINFFLAPYIVGNVGIEAYGFIVLANNFITYITILTVAINSMTGRYIAISAYKKMYRRASEYYSSVFFANIICVFILIIPLGIGIIYIDELVQVPLNILMDVQCLIGILFINFFLELLTINFSVVYLVKNQLFISSILQVKGNIIRVLFLVGFFYFLPAHISYLGISLFIMTIYIKGHDVYYKKKLFPELRFSKNYISVSCLKEVVSSGIWNMITRLGNVLSGGLDLLIANIYLSPMEMGALALTKVIPNIINSIVGTVSNIFMPKFLELYAQGEMSQLIFELEKAMRIFSVFLSIPITLFLVFGDIFFSLWIPKQNSTYLYMLSCITLLPMICMGPASIIHNVFSVLNKIAVNSMLIILTGILNIIFVLIAINTFNGGLIAIVAIASLLSLSRNLLYTVPYGAIYLNCKPILLFKIVLKSFLGVIISLLVGCFIRYIFFQTINWAFLIIWSIVMIIVSLIVQVYIVFNKTDRKLFLKTIMEKYKWLLWRYFI